MIRPAHARIWLPWQPGPEDNPDGPVLVSLTDFTMRSLRFLPGIAGTGIRLGLGWYGISGAIGMLLWADPLHRRTGSLSVWTDRAALNRWVGLPLHVRTMRRNRDRGVLRATTWTSENFDRAAVRAAANQRLDARDYD